MAKRLEMRKKIIFWPLPYGIEEFQIIIQNGMAQNKCLLCRNDGCSLNGWNFQRDFRPLFMALLCSWCQTLQTTGTLKIKVMDSFYRFNVHLNSLYCTFYVNGEVRKRLQEDDEYLLEYLQQAIYASDINGVTRAMWDEGKVNVRRIIQEPDDCTQSSAPEPINLDEVEGHAGEDADLEDDGGLWSHRGRENNSDYAATTYLLQLRGSSEYMLKFSNKRHVKAQLWSKIATQMREAGFEVGEGKTGADRVRQKFNNLQKAYITFRRLANTTGESHRSPPPHYDELHAILGGADKVTLPHLTESLAQPQETRPRSSPQETTHSSTTDCAAVPSTSRDPLPLAPNVRETSGSTPPATPRPSRFTHVRRRLRPSVESSTVAAVRQLCAQQEEQNERHFAAIQDLLTQQTELLREQNQQRERLITVLEKIGNRPSGKENKKKRKHRSSSSDS